MHSAPRALCPHLEWAIGSVLGTRPELSWTSQPLEHGSVRAELSWAGRPGTAARLASALKVFPRIRVEVTEDAVRGVEGERFAVTPRLGLFRAMTAENGDVLVTEDRLRAALEHARTHADDPEYDGLESDIAEMIGTPWDTELEPFRTAGADSTVRWLGRVVS